MPVIHLTTIINAPIQQVFDLARSVELHLESTEQTNERVIAGRTSGLFELNDQVTWQAKHLGIRQRLTVGITQMEPPHYFEDCMIKGAFKRFRHEHFFEQKETYTIMTNRFDFESPLGILGHIANKLLLTAYMRRFLEVRNHHIKYIAERG